MTPLEDHVARAEATGSYVLEVCQDIPGDPDAPAQPGFVMMLRADGLVMLAELSISSERSGMSAVISAYNTDGTPRVMSLTDIGVQVIVTVD